MHAGVAAPVPAAPVSAGLVLVDGVPAPIAFAAPDGGLPRVRGTVAFAPRGMALDLTVEDTHFEGRQRAWRHGDGLLVNVAVPAAGEDADTANVYGLGFAVEDGAPRGTLVFCQVFPNACNICCWDPREEEPFRHLSDNPNTAYQPGQWNRMELIAEAGECQLLLNGEAQAQAHIPISTEGMLGLVVNFASNAKVRLRNLQLTLLKPTPQQLLFTLRRNSTLEPSGLKRKKPWRKEWSSPPTVPRKPA